MTGWVWRVESRWELGSWDIVLQSPSLVRCRDLNVPFKVVTLLLEVGNEEGLEGVAGCVGSGG